jgi:hypothetical protein
MIKNVKYAFYQLAVGEYFQFVQDDEPVGPTYTKVDERHYKQDGDVTIYEIGDVRTEVI